jgi:hypothetical protein
MQAGACRSTGPSTSLVSFCSRDSCRGGREQGGGSWQGQCCRLLKNEVRLTESQIVTAEGGVSRVRAVKMKTRRARLLGLTDGI